MVQRYSGTSLSREPSLYVRVRPAQRSVPNSDQVHFVRTAGSILNREVSSIHSPSHVALYSDSYCDSDSFTCCTVFRFIL